MEGKNAGKPRGKRKGRSWPILNIYCQFHKYVPSATDPFEASCTFSGELQDRNLTLRRNETGKCEHKNCPIRNRARNQAVLSRNLAAWEAQREEQKTSAAKQEG